MKKYWINELTKRQVIHAPTEEIANKLCNKFHELGLKWCTKGSYLKTTEWDRYNKETCYLPSKGEYSGFSHFSQQGYEILTIDQLLDFQENKYPKVMEVSSNNRDWCKRVVFMEKNGKFLAWAYVETIKEAESRTDIFTWEYAREVNTILELTIDDIAEKFNVSPEQIKIKK